MRESTLPSSWSTLTEAGAVTELVLVSVTVTLVFSELVAGWMEERRRLRFLEGKVVADMTVRRGRAQGQGGEVRERGRRRRASLSVRKRQRLTRLSVTVLASTAIHVHCCSLRIIEGDPDARGWCWPMQTSSALHSIQPHNKRYMHKRVSQLHLRGPYELRRRSGW